MPETTVHCSRCPAICCRLKVLIVAGDDPPEQYIDEDEDGAQVMGKADDGWCSALDRENMRCGIYERRPLVCREFEMAGADCLAERAAWQRAAAELR